MQKIVVFGANGPTGRLLVQQALAQGYAVTAVTRHSDTFPIQAENLHVLEGDVLDPAAVEQAVEGQEAVLSTLGAPFTQKNITVYSAGMANILGAMQKSKVRRLICVTSSATDPKAGHHGGWFFAHVLEPLVVNFMGKALYEDMRKMETMVRNSDFDWTIIRPSGLFQTAKVTPYKIAENYLNATYTSRTDLADSMLRLLKNNQYCQKFVAVGTYSEKPKLLSFFLREAVAKKA